MSKYTILLDSNVPLLTQIIVHNRYFESRPELTAQLQSSSGPSVGDAVSNIASRFNNPSPPANPGRRIGAAGSNPPPAARGLVSSQVTASILH